MPLTRTLQDMRTELAYLAGIGSDAVGGVIDLHSTPRLNAILNQSFRSLRSWVTQKGYRLYKLATTHAALPTTATVTGEQFAQVAWPADAVDILGVDVLISTDEGWRPLEAVDWEERREFEYEDLAAGPPLAWSPITSGTVASTTFTAGSIALFPMPVSGSYKIWYLPRWDDITTEGHLFLAHDEDWFQWMLWQSLTRVFVRENDAQGRLAEAHHQLNPIGPDGKPNMATVAGRILAAAPRHVKAGPKTMRRASNY